MKTNIFRNITAIVIFLLACLPSTILAQLDEEYETLLLEEEEQPNLFNTAFKPIIGIGQGMFTFLGDVKTKNAFTPTNGYWGTQAIISRTIGKSYELDLFFIFGKFGGEQTGYSTETTPNPESNNIENQLLNSPNKNFYTDVTVSGINFTYNFINAFNRKRPVLPYISVGIEAVQFSPKTDLLYTENGISNPYHYWSDGTIRNVSENSGQSSVIITRDYEYESDARKVTGQDYSFFSLAIPIEIGANVTVSDRVTLRLGNSFHIPFTDYIDNYSKGSGILANDFFNYAYVSLRLDMFSAKEEIIAVENFKNIKFIVTDNEDADNDGIDDFNDYCPNTEPGVKVDFRGCPFDEDRDGVPDYRDKQKGTPHDALGVRDNGIRILDMHVISMLYEPQAVQRKDIYNYYNRDDSEKKEYDGIPTKFIKLDVNEDGWISPSELQKAINDFFDFKSNLTTDDIHELKDFFFHQK